MVNGLTFSAGSAPKFGARFWEPVVDGRPLRDLLTFLDPGITDPEALRLGPVGESIPVFTHSWPGGMCDEVHMLVGQLPSSLDDGRVPLYICPVCGDLGCGAVSVAVDRQSMTVTWRDFGWDDDLGGPADDHAYRRFGGGPFTFDRGAYDAEIRGFVETFAEVRAAVASPGSVPSRERSRRWSRLPFRHGPH